MIVLISNNTWELVDRQKGTKPVSCKWTYVIKKNKDSSVDKYKARLVAKVFSQPYGVNYNETFAPVVHSTTLKVLLALTAEYNLLLHQVDISFAYLNAHLDEEIYMSQPEGFIDTNNRKKVLNFKKSLYGLTTVWSSLEHLNSVIDSFGLRRSQHDP